MTTHQIQIEQIPARVNSGKGNSDVKYRVLHKGKELCTARTPACEGARKLLEVGIAQRADVLQICRGDRIDMTGSIGWFADRTVNESRGDGKPRFAKWAPFWSQYGEKHADADD